MVGENALRVTRCDGTEHAYDVERNYFHTDGMPVDHKGSFVWCGRLVVHKGVIEITRGRLTPEEVACVRGRLPLLREQTIRR